MTYSIVAVDPATGEVGGAGTSCLSGSDVFVIYRGVPGRGVVHAQARYNIAGRDRAAELLGEGRTAAEALSAVTALSFDRSISLRQYGIVDVAGQAQGYTGTDTTAFAADHQGRVAGFAYSVQGNILTSAAVLEQAGAAFEAAGCDLAERLMQALRAGAGGGEGDSRCTEQGIPSDSAFLQVERPSGSEGDYLALHIENSGSADPLPLLESKLDAWRVEHPCPVALVTAGASAPPAAGEAGGCGCHAAGALLHDWSAGALFGLFFVVTRWRRAARQLGPALLPRQQPRAAIPRRDHAELRAREIHGGEQ
jgi:uncharacterized Ntn-hydrolase superfamily protein